VGVYIVKDVAGPTSLKKMLGAECTAAMSMHILPTSLAAIPSSSGIQLNPVGRAEFPALLLAIR
jgi:hypothetical protein